MTRSLASDTIRVLCCAPSKESVGINPSSAIAILPRSNQAPATELRLREELRLTPQPSYFQFQLVPDSELAEATSFEVNPFLSLGRRCAVGILMRHSMVHMLFDKGLGLSRWSRIPSTLLVAALR